VEEGINYDHAKVIESLELSLKGKTSKLRKHENIKDRIIEKIDAAIVKADYDMATIHG